MSGDQEGVIHSASEGGVTGRHSPSDPFQLLVGPSTSDEFNTAHLRLIPIACWRVDDIRFDFDSSFIKPDIAVEVNDLASLLRLHPDCPLSVFGHADPVGSDDYNKVLSGRRATVIYALLISNTDPDRAVKLWRGVSTQENWGRNQRQTMQTTTGLPDSAPSSDLFQAYMQKLCPADFKLTSKDFLAQGEDPGGKGDLQGCSEFNPVLIFSQEKESQFDQNQDKSARNSANAPNRRVMVLLFRKGSKVIPTKWPCPRVTEGVAGCRKRFFSDGERRRNTRLPDQDRKFEETQDTFACRFYDRISSQSPCGKLVTPFFRYGLEMGQGLPWSESATFRIASDDGTQERIFAMSEGFQNGTLREFVFADARPGVRYKGEVIQGDLRLELFAPIEIFRIQDSADPLNILPLPEPQPFQEQAQAPVDAEVPSSFDGPDEVIDFDVEDAALPFTLPTIPFLG